jgi:hypothetical protein
MQIYIAHKCTHCYTYRLFVRHLLILIFVSEARAPTKNNRCKIVSSERSEREKNICLLKRMCIYGEADLFSNLGGSFEPPLGTGLQSDNIQCGGSMIYCKGREVHVTQTYAFMCTYKLLNILKIL